MTAIHTTVQFEHLSGLPVDRIINTFTFVTASAWTATDLDNIETALKAFYNTSAPPATSPVAWWMAPCLSRVVPMYFRHYDIDGNLDGSPAGSPVRQGGSATVLGVAGQTSGLPAEVSCALSFHSPYGTDVEFGPGTRPRARDRGRVYIGPLGAGVLSSDATTKRSKIDVPVQQSIVYAGQRLMTDASTTWCVWSRKNASVSPVNGVWVDDAFDTQRKRGEKATTRIVLP